MKNIDKLKQMNAEELAEIMQYLDTCKFCIYCGHCGIDNDCKTGIKEWLEKDTNNNYETEINKSDEFDNIIEAIFTATKSPFEIFNGGKED